MTKEFIRYVVKSEADYTVKNDGKEVEKVQCMLDVVVGLVEDPERKLAPMVYELEVTNLNSQRGYEMDEQRLNECMEFVEQLNKKK